MTTDIDTLVRRLRNAALPDPHDEREVMHAPLLRDAADEIERLRATLKQLDVAYVRLLEAGRDRIIALGGACDPVDVMEAADPELIQVRRVLSA